MMSYVILFFFFFKQKTAYEVLRSLLGKQKTAYEMLRSLVGSEMCIRDRNIGPGAEAVDRYTVGSIYPTVSVSYYTSDAADEEDSVDLGGRRIIKKKRK